MFVLFVFTESILLKFENKIKRCASTEKENGTL